MATDYGTGGAPDSDGPPLNSETETTGFGLTRAVILEPLNRF